MAKPKPMSKKERKITKPWVTVDRIEGRGDNKRVVVEQSDGTTKNYKPSSFASTPKEGGKYIKDGGKFVYQPLETKKQKTKVKSLIETIKYEQGKAQPRRKIHKAK